MKNDRILPESFLLVGLLLSAGQPAAAQIDFQVLEPVSMPALATVGNGLDLMGEWLVSGMQRPNNPLHVFRLNSGTGDWELFTTFEPPMGLSTPGTNLAGRNKQVAVGAERFVIGQENSGLASKSELVQVYAFDPVDRGDPDDDFWFLEQLLEPAGPADPAFFGSAVDLAAGWIAVGAITEGVWLYELQTSFWSQQQVIDAPVGSTLFADDVAMDGNVLAVIDSNSTDAVYIYERSGGVWAHARTVTVPSALGTSALALDGPHLAFGDFFSGQLTVLERSGATWANTPVATTLSPYDYDVGLPALSGLGTTNFTPAIAISGNLLAAGAPTTSGSHRGAVFLWEKVGGEWMQVQKMYGPAGGNDIFGFGGELAIDGTLIATGGPETVELQPEGRVWVLDVSSRPQWIDEGNGLAGTSGTPSLVGFGNLHGPMLLPTTPDFFRLDLTGAAPSADAYLVAGLTAVNLSFKGGVMVPSVDQIIDNLTTSAAGALSLGAEWTLEDDYPGFEIYYQFWIEDAGGPSGFAASNAVRSVAP